MQIPTLLKIMGHEYRVVIDPLLSLERGHVGECCSNSLRINISGQHPESNKAEALLHEVIEALNYRLELKLEHPQITALSEGLFQVMRDNQLNFAGREES